MRVNLYDGDTQALLASDINLREAMGDDDAEYLRAVESLRNEGRYWTGGGAAPLFLLMAG